MVTFRLIEEDEQRIVYWYFPEGKGTNIEGSEKGKIKPKSGKSFRRQHMNTSRIA